MASNGSRYPGYLNPFGDVEEKEEQDDSKPTIVVRVNEYPDHLDPFGKDDEDAPDLNDYDDSLNPFGDEAVPETNEATKIEDSKSQSPDRIQGVSKLNQSIREGGNPFTDDDDRVEESKSANEPSSICQDESIESKKSPSPDLIEPPKPLPRTKSLLKKEQAHKKRLQKQQVLNIEQANSLQSTTSSTTSSSSITTDIIPALATVGSFQRRKRLAPPVPINFKRQVCGSLDAIEDELNGIGDKLAIIDKESTLCQETLKLKDDQVDEADIKSTRSKFAELIKRRNSIVRRQKELMYKKRELKLDQLHSDIEYELRMIGNKQLSTRTEEDEIKERELLKKLVEIVEEKNDIVENLNKDTSCDSRDVQEAFRRLNIAEYPPENLVVDKKHNNNVSTTVGSSTFITSTSTTTNFLSKKGSCDKSTLAKLSRIATLLPKSNTIKLKRKRLFKKDSSDSRPIER